MTATNSESWLSLRWREPLRDPEETRAKLRRRAETLFRFSPDLARDPWAQDPALLLEIRRTAVHFQGLDSMRATILEVCREEEGRAPLSALAPYPAAASVLSHPRAAPTARSPSDEKSLEECLRTLPLEVLDPAPAVANDLHLLGLRTLGDLDALPPLDLARRSGEELTEALDRIFGRHPSRLPRIHPETPFRESLSWWPPRTDIAPILFAAKRLLDRAERVLRRRGEGLVEAEVLLFMPETKETRSLLLRPTRPTASADHLLRILQHRLETLELGGPVDRLELRFRRREYLRRAQALLFEEEIERAWSEETMLLLDHLSARLGAENLGAPRLVADHRPECAWVLGPPGETSPDPVSPPTGRRPLTLHAQPCPLDLESDDAGHPRRILRGEERGPVSVLGGPEVIESGWWDGRDVRRGYFEIATGSGARWWIFRDLRSGFWFRHGVFD